MRSCRSITVVAAAVAMTMLFPSLATLADIEPYGPAGNGVLIYEVDGDLFAIDGPDQAARPITSGPARDSAPSFSRDGSRLAFLREEGGRYPALMVADPDGGHLVELSDATDQFDWSPDSARLLVNHDVGGKPWVSVVDADGASEPRPLDLGGTTPNDGWAAWRPPDGREVIFTGHPREGSSDLGVYAIRPDGTGLRTVGVVSATESDQQRSFSEPRVSPDGSTLAYWNWELSDAGVLDGYLHLRDLDTGVDRRFQARPGPEAEIDPTFSPDGRWLALEAQSETEVLSELIVAPVDGSQPGVALGPTFSYRDERAYAFSPDGTAVVLTVNGLTFIIDVATGVTTPFPGVPTLPAWQPVPTA